MDLEALSKKIDELLAKETTESLTQWLNTHRQNSNNVEEPVRFLVTLEFNGKVSTIVIDNMCQASIHSKYKRLGYTKIKTRKLI